MIFAKDELKLLWPFYVVTILITLFNIVPIFWVVYFQLKGFTISDVSFALAFLSIATFMFEIPTGAIADIFGRKRSVVLGCFLIGIGIFLIPFATNIFFLNALFLFWGIAFTLPSGAEDAWVVDSLKEKGKENLIQKYYTKKNIIAAVCFMGAGLIATFLMYSFDFETKYRFFNIQLFGSDFLWFAQAIVFIISGFIYLIFAKENFERGKSNVRKELMKSLKLSRDGIKYSFEHPIILGILVSSLLMVVVFSFWSIGYQPFLYNLNFDVKKLGLFNVAAAGVALFFSLIAEKLASKFKHRKYYIALVSVLEFLTTLLIIRVFGIWIGVIFSVIKWNFDNLRKPIINPLLQEQIPSDKRATIGSVKSVFMSIGQFIGLIVIGFIIDAIGPRMAVFYSAFLLIPVIIIYLKMKD